MEAFFLKLLAIDGNSIVNRAFFGVRQLTSSDGTPTNAVYGFLAILQKLLADESPDALCVMFDTAAPTFRHVRYDGYKAHRKGMPDELAVQMPILKDVLDAMNVARYEQEGWEADDLLGAIAKNCEAESWECVIVTGDKDTLQLVTDFTRVKNVKTRMGQTETVNYTPAAFFEEYGFEPLKMIDLKALMGDSSDNIPGVAGVGEKTALDLVRRFGGIREIYDNLESLDIKDTVRKKLEAGRESAELSYELATIRVDAPLEIDISESVCREPDNDKLYGILKRLGFTRMIKEFSLKPPADAGAAPGMAAIVAPEIVEVVSAADCAALLSAAKAADYVALQIDTEFFDSVAVVFTSKRRDGSSACLRRGATEGFDEALAELLSGSVRKVGHDVKDIMRACLERGLSADGWVFDTALAAYLLSPTDSNYSVARISERYCGYTPGTADEDGGQMDLLADAGNSIAEEAFAIGLLRNALEDRLRELELDKLYYEIELPLCRMLADMEMAGFLVDRGALVGFGEMLAERITEMEKQIHECAGGSFNIS